METAPVSMQQYVNPIANIINKLLVYNFFHFSVVAIKSPINISKSITFIEYLEKMPLPHIN